MDAASLRAARIDPESASALPAFDVVDHCALLVEYQAATAEDLAVLTGPAPTAFSTLPLVELPVLSTTAAIRGALWHIRKGLYATIAGARPSGTTALLEDIAVPVDRLCRDLRGPAAAVRLARLPRCVIFGHAKDGNIHFLLTEHFDDPASVVRYAAFTEDMVELVLGAGGTLKAEHGTGKIMAPFVARQYGPELYDDHARVKRAFDPQASSTLTPSSQTTPTCISAT